MASIFFDSDSAPITQVFTTTSINGDAFMGGAALAFSGNCVLRFEGTAIALFGGPLLLNGKPGITPIQISIDGGPRYNTSFIGPGTFGPFFQSPTLRDDNATHTLTIFDLFSSGTSVQVQPSILLDYVVVTAGKDTALDDGKRLIVDDEDSSITYEGSWTRNASVLVDSSLHTFIAVGNGTRQTRESGSSATFHFTGTSVAVYGISPSGPLQVIFTLDGSPGLHKNVTAEPGGTSSRFLWYSWDEMDPGEHTLGMQLAEIDEGSDTYFTLDYFVYTPSFTTLAAKPPSVMGIPVSSTSSVASGTAGPSGASKSYNAVIGAIVGAVLGVMLVIAVLFFYWRRVARKRAARISKPFLLPQMMEGLEDTHGNSSPHRKPPLSGLAPLRPRDQQHNPPPGRTIDSGDSGRRVAARTSRMQRLARLASRLSERTQIEPFPLPATPASDHYTIVQRKPPLPPRSPPGIERQPSAGEEENGIVALDARERDDSDDSRHTRIQELVMELQRELAVTNTEERNSSLGLLLTHGAAGHRRHRSFDDDALSDGSSDIISILPPPYVVHGTPHTPENLGTIR
ncbi:hypothetical protein FPV67DRAFT_1680751 [Lyophyllum atratum]|nr:hypothetical protein FPV67DRAFT_1680751 [Lyophyllum atratum]